MNSNSLEVLKASFDLPILTREQEVILFQQRDEDGQLTQEARKNIFSHNIRLVINIAKKTHLEAEMEDKIGWGFIGLDDAIGKFDWQMGYKFSTYASHWIRQKINRGIDGSSVICGFQLPSSLRRAYFSLLRTLERESVEPSVELLTKRFGMSEATALIFLRYLKNDSQSVPLDKEIVSKGGDSNGRLGEFLPDPKAESAFDFMINLEIVKSLLSCLPKRQHQVVSLYYLVDGATLDSVARQTGMTPQRVSQLLSAALEGMRRKAQKLGIRYP